MSLIIPYTCDLTKAMMFVDGENLAIRYGSMLQARTHPVSSDHLHISNVAVWSTNLNPTQNTPAMIRKYYYTAVQGDHPKVNEVELNLKEFGIETPRVFKKEKGKPSKRVDITLAIDMLTHAADKHYDIAILVAGDEDYVPLVEAVQRKGTRVGLGFLSDGLSPALRHAADFFMDLDPFLFA